MSQSPGAERAELLAGAAVLAVAAGFLLWSTGAFNLASASGSYALTAAFPDVNGLAAGTEVRLAGVRVGRVESVTLNRQTYLAEARLSVPGDLALPTDSAALIQSDGLLGGAYIELRPGGAPDNLQPGDEIEDVQGHVGLLQLMMKFVDSQSGSSDAAPAAKGNEP